MEVAGLRKIFGIDKVTTRELKKRAWRLEMPTGKINKTDQQNNVKNRIPRIA